MSEILAISKAFEKDYYVALNMVAEQAMTGAVSTDEEEKREQPYPLTVTDHGVSVIHVQGMLTNRESWINKYYNLISYQKIQESIIYMLEETDTKVVVFKYDTPGGAVNGMTDVAEMISSLQIPTISFASGNMASAGYFLGSQSDHVYAGTLSMVGSIGVILSWYNLSAYLKEKGIQPERFRSGDLKGVGDGDFNLSKKEKDHVNHLVMYMADVFYGIVSAARGIPRDLMKSLGITSGKEFIGAEAKQAMLIDDIMSYDKVLLKAYGLAEKEALTDPVNTLYTGQ